VYQADIGNDRIFDKRKLKNSRPISAKAIEKQPSKPTKVVLNRPTSASRQTKLVAAGLMRQRSKQLQREPDSNLLAKLKPRSVQVDKERLFEENLSLKMLNNHLQQENTRLKTKLNQLDRELGRRDDFTDDTRTEARGGQKSHLVANLKQNVKELRQELTLKEEEMAVLRQNLKSTKLGELEVEIQVYVDECTRLRHHLEEMLRQREETPVQYGVAEDKTYQQSLQTSNLQVEALTDGLRAAQADAERWKLKAQELEKSKRAKKSGEVQGLRSELQKLRVQMDSFQEQSTKKIQDYENALAKQKAANSLTQDSYRKLEGTLKDRTRELDLLRAQQAALPSAKQQTSAPKQERLFTEVVPPVIERLPPVLHKLFTRLQKVLNRKRIMLSVFLSLLDKKNNGYIETTELFKGLKHNKAGMKWPDLVQALLLMGGSELSISISGLEAWHAKYKFVDDVTSDTSDDEPASPVKKQATEQAAKKPQEMDVNAVRLLEEAKRTAEERPKPPAEAIRKDRPTSAKPVIQKPEASRQESGLTAIKEESKVVKPPEKKEVMRPAEEYKVEAPQKAIKPEPPRKEQPVKEIPPFNKSEKAEVKSKKPLSNSASSSSWSDEDYQPAAQKPMKSAEIVTEADVKPILRHIAMRSQLHRLLREEVAGIVAKSTGKPALSEQVLKSLLSSQPFSLSEPEAAKLSRYLIQKKESPQALTEVPAKELAKALIEVLEQWVVLAEDDEQQLDRHISQLVAKHMVSFKEACKMHDHAGSGVISFKAFKEAVEEVELEFSEGELRYMQLLFYSHNMELDQVPYKQFIQAYSKMSDPDSSEEEASLDEEARAAIVRDKLDVISQALIKLKVSVASAFKHTQGLVHPHQLVDSLRKLGIPDFDKEDLIVFIEGLQAEDEEQLCISLEYLEELLAHYGVPAGSRGMLDDLDMSSNEEDSEGSISHIKKVSMLDTSG
jgi:Ca2+-binding EF-hand superfamily protein